MLLVLLVELLSPAAGQDQEVTSIRPFSVEVWHSGSLKGKMATAGLGSVGGYLEPLQGTHLRGGDSVRHGDPLGEPDSTGHEEDPRGLTGAAAGSRGPRPPSSGRTCSCRSLWCCTPASTCCRGNGSASGPRRPSPRSTGSLEDQTKHPFLTL